MSDKHCTAECSITHLDLSLYSNLIDPEDDANATMQRTYLYSQRVLDGSRKKHDVWSVYPIPWYVTSLSDPPPNIHESSVRAYSTDSTSENVWFDVVDRTTRTTRLARNIIGGSNKYHVGPLDFCGVARIVAAQGSGQPQYVRNYAIGDMPVANFL